MSQSCWHNPLTGATHGNTEVKDKVTEPICNTVSFFSSRSAGTSLDIRYGKQSRLTMVDPESSLKEGGAPALPASNFDE